MSGGKIVETGFQGHECKYEKRRESFFDWKETAIDFMGQKEVTNGNLTLKIKSLKKN